MDRTLCYPDQITYETDPLSIQRNTMVALGALIRSVFGTSTFVEGLTCSPTAPASMQVVVGSGMMGTLSTVDATAFSSLDADSSPLMKMGINLGETTFTLTAPTTPGYSVNYLIEAALQEADGGAQVLPYWNAANPDVPYSGPSNSGATQYTTRNQTVGLQLKAGAAATAGSQTTPAVDVGWTALYVITVNYGQTTITSGSIAAIVTAPVIPFKLPLLTPGFSRWSAFTTTGVTSFTVPASTLRVTVTGGGGGGGGATTASGGYDGGGGGAGGTGKKIITGLTIGSTVSITIGAGGGGGAAGVNGTTGGTSSFGAYCSATGGAGGSSTSTSSAGGLGGDATGGDFNISGGTGGSGARLPTFLTPTGNGAASYWGGGGEASALENALRHGRAYGSGGGGGSYGSVAGGYGMSGIVVVEW